VLAVIAYGVLYVMSERVLHAYAFAPIPLRVPTDAESIAKGKRLAKLYGCSEGCHGKGIEGAVQYDQVMVGRIVAPNLTSAVRRYSDPELAAIIRTGVRPDGHNIIMMSELLRLLTDDELGDIVAYLRSVPAVEGPGPEVRLGPAARFFKATGRYTTTARYIKTDTLSPPPASGEGAQRGRHIASTVCADCHGSDLSGGGVWYDGTTAPPSLQIVAAYTPEAFTELMRNGIALGGRKLGHMREAALGQLSVLTQAQIADLYSYLHELPVPPAKRP
jgi:cytochrome c553